jgi:protein-tyrosine phosphatase
MIQALSRLNFRDLGGLPTVDGGRVRHGVLIRCEGPGSFDELHHAELAALGIRSVADLRSEGERAAAPHRWTGDECQVLELDMNTDLRARRAEQWEALRTDPTADRALAAMLENYRLMPSAFLPHLPVLVDTLLAGEAPTGVVVALLLEYVNVGRDAIMADYLQSEIFGQNILASGRVEERLSKSFGFVPTSEMARVLTGVQPDFLDVALEAVVAGWGGVAGYFAAAGVDSARGRELKRRLTDS